MYYLLFSILLFFMKCFLKYKKECCLWGSMFYSAISKCSFLVYIQILLSKYLFFFFLFFSPPAVLYSFLSPGIASLIRLLSSAGEESQPGLAVLLCEILTAVFLSLFVHGMTTHSCNELFRIMAHPLNSKLWVTVFGGGARIPVIEKLSSPTRTPPPGDSFGGCSFLCDTGVFF